MQGMQYLIIYALMMALLFYLFMVIPGKRKHNKKQEMLKDVAVGDTVITMGGIVAKVLEREQDTLILELMENRDCRIRVLIYSIKQIAKKGEALF
ncbi:MAG: preprotein translocase subunit YajC [Sporomusa sp.]